MKNLIFFDIYDNFFYVQLKYENELNITIYNQKLEKQKNRKRRGEQRHYLDELGKLLKSSNHSNELVQPQHSPNHHDLDFAIVAIGSRSLTRI